MKFRESVDLSLKNFTTFFKNNQISLLKDFFLAVSGVQTFITTETTVNATGEHVNVN